MLHDERTDHVAHFGRQTSGICGGDGGRLASRPLDGLGSRRPERPSRAIADSQHAFAGVERQQPLTERARLRGHTRGVEVEVDERASQLHGQVLLDLPEEDLAVDRRIVIEAHGHQPLMVVAGELQAHGWVAAPLHQDAPHFVGVVGNAAWFLARERHTREQVGNGPGVGHARHGAQAIGEATNLAQHDRLVEVGAHADKKHRRRAPLPGGDLQTSADDQTDHDDQHRGHHERTRTGATANRGRQRLRRPHLHHPAAEGDHSRRQPRQAAERGHPRHRHDGEGSGRCNRHRQRPRHPTAAIVGARERQPGAPGGQQGEKHPGRRELGRKQPATSPRIGPERMFLEWLGRRRRQARGPR